MKRKRIILVVGCGSIGQRHLRLLNERSDVTLWACDTDKSILKEANACAHIARNFSNYRTALKKGPDMVWVCTPDHMHAPIAIDGLRAGADVFCEKPLADNVESGKAIVRIIKDTGRIFSVGYVMRCEPGFRLIKRFLDEMEIGNVISGEVCLGSYESLLKSKTDFALQRSGGLILDYSHEIDYLSWFLGSIVEVTAMATSLGDLKKKPDPNIINAILRFTAGPIVGLHLDYVQFPSRRSIELFGDKGRLSYQVGDDYLKLYMQGKTEPKRFKITGNRDDWYRMEHALFFESIEKTSPPMVSAECALDTLKTVAAIIEAYECKSIITL